eukprot:2750026-Pyramimonas_sp.AAC.1
MGTPGMPVELAGIPERAGSVHGTGPLPACRLERTSFPTRSRLPLVLEGERGGLQQGVFNGG